MEWIKDQLDKLRNRRTAQGAYEETGGQQEQGIAYGAGGPTRRGRGVEDDAWDTRVGNEEPYASGPGGYTKNRSWDWRRHRGCTPSRTGRGVAIWMRGLGMRMRGAGVRIALQEA